jgi:hypothetical protein
MVDVPLVLTTLTSAMGLAKQFVEIDKTMDGAERKLKVAELSSALADAKVGITELQEEVKAREQEIDRLKRAFAAREQDMTTYRSFTYKKGKRGQPVGMPMCPRCIEMDGRFMTLQRRQGRHGDSFCPACETEYSRVPRMADAEESDNEPA